MSGWKRHFDEYRTANPDVPYKTAQQNAKATYQSTAKFPARPRKPKPRKVKVPKEVRQKMPRIKMPKLFQIKAPKLVKIAKGDPEVNRLKKKIKEARKKLAGAGFNMRRQ